MSEQEQINAGLAVSILKLLLRSRTVTEDAVLAIAAEYDLLAERSQYAHEAEIHHGVAHQLRASLLDLAPPAAVAPAVEAEAQFRRRQMRERTSRLGKPEDQA